jgi:hypothetical protein
MNRLLALSLILLSPALVMAQTTGETAKKPATKTVAKAPAKKTETSSRTQLNSAANQAAAGIRAADVALTPAELAIADRIQTGTMPCELGASVVVEADPKAPGYFNVRGKGYAYRMHPVVTSTGAIRLEDNHDGGAVWLQLSNKSMLMDQKAGKRLADECASPAQLAVAEALKKNPAPSLLDMSTPAAGCGKEKC